MFFEVQKLRYLLLLMGFFSTYCGLIYNDFTSIPMEIFGPSCYDLSNNQTSTSGLQTKDQGCVYQVGVDPAWYLATNELTYLNSLKMKIAVILGVAQMALGVVLKGCNYRHQGKNIEFRYEFLPQLVMLFALFGFMDVLIIIKWLTDFDAPSDSNLPPPSIISTMINMVLGFGEQSNPSNLERELIPLQPWIMRFLLITILICVPLMLFVKPIHEHREQ
jgi:V-type H+-transporting ATPase subunit a